MAPTSKRLRYVFLRRSGQVEETVASKTLVQRIQSGELSPDDEISAEGKHWVRLIQHPQLEPLFEGGGAKPSERSVPNWREDALAAESAAEVPEETPEPDAGHAEALEENAASPGAPPVPAGAGERERPAARGAEEASQGQKVFLFVMVTVLLLILGYNLLLGGKKAEEVSQEPSAANTAAKEPPPPPAASPAPTDEDISVPGTGGVLSGPAAEGEPAPATAGKILATPAEEN